MLCSMTVSMESFSLGGISSTKALHRTVTAEKHHGKTCTAINFHHLLLVFFLRNGIFRHVPERKDLNCGTKRCSFAPGEEMWNIALVPNFYNFYPFVFVKPSDAAEL